MTKDELVEELQEYVGQMMWDDFLSYCESKGYTREEVEKADSDLMESFQC